MKTFICGDVHGSGQELLGLLDVVSPNSDDEIVLIGDCFDRGLHSHLVWDILQKPNVKCLMGNHDYKTFHWLQGRREWLPIQYYVALNLLVEHGVKPVELVTFLSALPYIMDCGDFIVVHSGVILDEPLKPSLSMNVFYSPNRNLYASDVETAYKASGIGKLPIPVENDGNIYWWDLYKGEKLVIYGHLSTVDGLPRIRRNTKGNINSVGIDTGAVHGGSLTCYCPEDDRFYTYRSGVDWAEQVRAMCKATPPLVNPELMAFVREQREMRKVEVGTVIVNGTR